MDLLINTPLPIKSGVFIIADLDVAWDFIPILINIFRGGQYERTVSFCG